MCRELLFLMVFFIGEIIFNQTWFRYLKSYFDFEEKNSVDNEKAEEGKTDKQKEIKKILLLLNLSTFKGILERFIITIGLIFGFAPILIVFGTIKLGTRFKDNQDIKNDYFLIGNFSSILIALLYYYVFKEMAQHFKLI
jgi:hypothetical protein